jgi:hypothetical protein
MGLRLAACAAVAGRATADAAAIPATPPSTLRRVWCGAVVDSFPDISLSFGDEEAQ